MHIVVEILVALIAAPVGLAIGIAAATWSTEPRKSGRRRAF